MCGLWLGLRAHVLITTWLRVGQGRGRGRGKVGMEWGGVGVGVGVGGGGGVEGGVDAVCACGPQERITALSAATSALSLRFSARSARLALSRLGSSVGSRSSPCVPSSVELRSACQERSLGSG